jgi:hypothetical protein
MSDGQGTHKRTALVTLVILSVVFLVSFVYSARGGNYFSICGFKWLTGLPCPGCGLTHSFCALGHGNLRQALEYNALGPILFVCAITLWVRTALIVFGFQRPARTIDRLAKRFRLLKVLGFAFALYGVGRILFLLIGRNS